MNRRPLIGINCDFRISPKTKASCSLAQSGYYDCVLTANALPVMIPPLIRESELLPIQYFTTCLTLDQALSDCECTCLIVGFDFGDNAFLG